MSEDPKVSGRYRELPLEEPPRALDDAILAASRRAVRRRWYFPVAAAAVIVLAVAVAVHIDRDQPVTEMATEAAPAAAPEPLARDALEQAHKPARQRFTPDPRADSSPPAAAPPAENRTARAQAQSAAAPRAAERSASLAKVAASPEQWLQGIADLRRQGRDLEADRELADFRKRYPDYRLSDEMKAKVERRQ
ncbi:hypothetical protein AYO46_04170 [Betaproteobacteria bacterium SCGC AG-212-J23]|nr:hypothetical protein AYO46_04170 [Betaproteobacteria bacterium SCGC AG-212-J23]